MADNFLHHIHRSLLLNKPKTLITWPCGDGTSQSYTGQDVLERIKKAQTALVNKGAGASTNILLAMPVSVDLICALLAIQSIGAVPVLPPAGASKWALIKLIRSLRIRFVLGANRPSLFVKAFAFANSFTLVAVSDKVNIDHPFEVVDVPPEQPALVTHSSGSTGNAKAIYRSHKVLLSQHHVLTEVFPPLLNQVDFPLFPNILLHNLALGVTSVLPDIPHFKLKEMQPARIVDQLIHQRIETATGNVFYFNSIIKYLHKHAITFPHVRAIGIGGSPVPDTLAFALKKFFVEATIYIIYGSSEAEPIAVRKIDDKTIHPFAGYKVGDIAPHLHLEIIPLGKVIVGSKKVTVGEIKVKGAHVATNNKDEALHTGDFGYVDEKNQLYLTARKGKEKICGGYQHYQLEHLLTNDSRVEKVAAIASDDGFVIYVQGNISKQEILNTLITYMPAQLVKSIHLRNDIPVDARHLSKILYHKVS